MTKKLAALLMALCFVYTALANTFTVSSNADNGAGTLREALTLAAANGSATYDTILFNLPDHSEAGRTIAFNSWLPLLSSRLVIDGTSQPGLPIGVSNARVIIRPGQGYLYIGFSMVRVHHIEIYGICFNAIPDDPDLSYTGGIYGYGCSDIVIGKPQKGNMFSECGSGINFSGLYSNIDSVNERITLQSNIFGLVNNGETAMSNFGDSYFGNCRDVLIGGDTEAEANYFTAWIEGIDVLATNYSNAAFRDEGYFRIKGNYFGVSYQTHTGIATTNGIQIRGWFIPSYLSIDIQDNWMPNATIGLMRITPRFKIRGNRVRNIWVNICNGGVIGGNGTERNIIGPGFSNAAGISIYQADTVTITRNVIQCNSKGILLQDVVKPLINITQINSTSVIGNADPASVIEVFGLDTCTSLCENGRIFLGQTIADGSGQWSLPTNFNGIITATATWPSGKTSEFSAARLNANNVQVKPATCGAQNGAITGIVIESGTDWHWEDQFGNPVGNNADLINVNPGRYRLVVGTGNNSCKTYSQFFDVQDLAKPQINAANLQITQPSCGQPTGAIRYTNSFNSNWTYQWMKNNTVINADYSTGNPMEHLAPGDYYLLVSLKNEPACVTQYGPFTLTNQSGPTMNESGAQVVNAVCSNANGSITGITVTNIAGNPFIQWVNLANQPVGNSLDVSGLLPGQYRLKFKDAGGCDTIFSAIYLVGNNGAITIDSSSRIITPGKCSANTGAIRNLVITGGTSYQWKAVSSGNIVSTSPDATGLAPGLYSLTVRNAFGCEKTSGLFAVPQTAPVPLSVVGSGGKAANCGQPNGVVGINQFNGNPAVFEFRWIDSATQQVVGTGPVLNNSWGGTYYLMAKDTNGCERQIYKGRIATLPVPYFDYSHMQVAPDICLSAKGSVTGVVVNDMRGNDGRYVWMNANMDSIGNTLNIQNLGEGTYYLKAIDLIGCAVTSQPVVVNNNNVGLNPPQYDDQVVLINTSASLTCKNLQQGIYQLFETSSSSTPLQENSTGVFATPPLSSDQTYYVRFVQGVCSSARVPVKVSVVDKTVIYVPTAFTPNRDGKNDELKAIAYGRIKLLYFSVYNRWGQKIFTTTKFNQGWDGKIAGKNVDTGVFIWVISAIDELTGHPIEMKGTSLLIR